MKHLFIIILLAIIFTPVVYAQSHTPDVPFTSQAPFGNWRDPRQQDGCEEASSLMAVTWARGQKSLEKKEAERHILGIAIYQQKFFGNYHDTSATATLERIIKGYFKYDRAEVKLNGTLEDIKSSLRSGAVVILPANGQKLKNPNFTAPGPERHNLVIRGYDAVKKEFITNDPGTRKGQGYRYKEKILEAAWRDYPTGRHAPISGIAKNMIIVRKK